ncbi:unnamed protein product, partial [Protopolystoma xenopodis]
VLDDSDIDETNWLSYAATSSQLDETFADTRCPKLENNINERDSDWSCYPREMTSPITVSATGFSSGTNTTCAFPGNAMNPNTLDIGCTPSSFLSPSNRHISVCSTPGGPPLLSAPGARHNLIPGHLGTQNQHQVHHSGPPNTPLTGHRQLGSVCTAASNCSGNNISGTGGLTSVASYIPPNSSPTFSGITRCLTPATLSTEVTKSPPRTGSILRHPFYQQHHTTCSNPGLGGATNPVSGASAPLHSSPTHSRYHHLHHAHYTPHQPNSSLNYRFHPNSMIRTTVCGSIGTAVTSASGVQILSGLSQMGRNQQSPFASSTVVDSL